MALVLGWLVGAASPAGAHASLVEMAPASGQTLSDPPTEVRLAFDEGVEATDDAVRLIDPSGTEVRGITATSAGLVVTAPLPSLDVDGSYTVSWHVVSDDGHPIRGAYLFHLREATLTEPADVGAASGSTAGDVVRAVGAVLALAGLVVCVGSAFAGARTVGSPRWWGLRWLPVVAGTTLLLGGSVIAVGSGPVDSLEIVLATASGRMALVAVVLAIAGLVSSVLPVHPSSDAVIAIGCVTAIALQGHALSLAPVALSGVATLAHVVAATLWLAGLFWLEHRSRTTEGDDLRRQVERLSPWGIAMVVVLAATGVALVVDRVPLDELATSTYGRLAVVKTVTLLVAVALAWTNRRVAVHGEPSDGVLRRGIRVEMVVLAVALVAGAVLAQVPPPAEGTGTPGGVFSERQAFGDGHVEVTVDPGTRGTNEIHVTALAPDGRLMAEAEELVVALELPDRDIGPIEPDMQVITNGHSMTYASIPVAGDWELTVTSRVDGGFRQLTATFEVPIGG